MRQEYLRETKTFYDEYFAECRKASEEFLRVMAAVSQNAYVVYVLFEARSRASSLKLRVFVLNTAAALPKMYVSEFWGLSTLGILLVNKTIFRPKYRFHISSQRIGWKHVVVAEKLRFNCEFVCKGPDS